MKKFCLTLFILIITLSFAQTHQFSYEYISIPDSTKRDKSVSEIMILNIDKTQSEYYSLNRYTADSTMLAESRKGSMVMPPAKKMSVDRIIKKADSENILFITQVGSTQYYVDEVLNLSWKLYPEYITVLNYKAQKATAEFGGRKWTAWFVKDLPFQEGPYKFKKLPGLIVKLEDETKSHQFELKGIKNLQSNPIYPDLNNFRKVPLKGHQFKKAYQNHRKNPTADLMGQIPDQTDSEGNFRRGSDIIREIDIYQRKQLEKDNNIIEIDLLKN